MADATVGTDGRAAMPSLSAGTLLREARHAQKLNLAALADAMKVPAQKLEALENDQFDLLPDATFARALAQSVCRHLKIDPQPVLSRLPQSTQQRLDRLGGGLNAPIGHHDARSEGGWGVHMARPIVWVPMLLVVATLAVLLLPIDFRFDRLIGAGSSAPSTVSETVSEPVVAGTATTGPAGESANVVVPPVMAPASPLPEAAPTATSAASVPLQETTAATASASTPSGTPTISITSRTASWIQAVDAGGRTLVQRELKAGDQMVIDGAMPISLTVGNASKATVLLRGQPVDLAPSIRRADVARLQLQ